MAIKTSPTEVEEKAEEYFRNGGYHCAESMMLAFNEVLVVPVDLQYVSGFGGGLGETRCLCAENMENIRKNKIRNNGKTLR